MNDKDILKLYKRDPRNAFGIVVKQHQEAIYWYIRKSVISHEDTNDIIQNTFKNAWPAFEKFKGNSSISTWLHRIATNEMYAHLKKNAKITYDTEHVEYLLSQERDHGYFSGDEAQEILAKAVASLPERQKEVFVLKYFQEKTYQEIVDILGGSIGSHKASFYHSKEKIKKMISNSLNLFDF